MANFYTEVPELKFQLNNPMMAAGSSISTTLLCA